MFKIMVMNVCLLVLVLCVTIGFVILIKDLAAHKKKNKYSFGPLVETLMTFFVFIYLVFVSTVISALIYFNTNWEELEKSKTEQHEVIKDVDILKEIDDCGCKEKTTVPS